MNLFFVTAFFLMISVLFIIVYRKRNMVPRLLNRLSNLSKREAFGYGNEERRIVERLREIGDPKAIEPLLKFYIFHNVYFETVIQKSIGKIVGHKEQLLWEALSSEDPKIRENAIYALKDKKPICSEATHNMLVDISQNDANIDVRCVSIYALGRFGHCSFIPVLEELLTDEEEPIRNHAREAIEQILENSVEFLTQSISRCRNCGRDFSSQHKKCPDCERKIEQLVGTFSSKLETEKLKQEIKKRIKE